MINFKPLPQRPRDWDDLINGFHTKTLFHESAWLDHLLDIHPSGRIDYYQIFDSDLPIGFHCGLRIQRMMVPIQGSPLGGTGTNYMGPIVPRGVDQRALIRGLRQLLGLRRYLHLELSHYWLEPEVLLDEGFNIQKEKTHLCHLPSDVDKAWAMLKSSGRNRIRKADKNGLIVSRTDSPAIVDHYFDQFEEVYGRQGLQMPFGKDRVLSLFRRLAPADRLLPLWVKKDNEVVACGLFPYDENCIYFWGAASWMKYRHFCPNEALHWQVIKFAVENGISAYNMCGGNSRFKNKFGGEDVPYNIYYKSGMPLLPLARRLYRARHFKRLKR